MAGAQTPNPVVWEWGEGSVPRASLGCLTGWVKPVLKSVLGLPLLAQMVGPFLVGPWNQLPGRCMAGILLPCFWVDA